MSQEVDWQARGPEFNPQCHKTEKRRREGGEIFFFVLSVPAHGKGV
jgi:hypothetical protein